MLPVGQRKMSSRAKQTPFRRSPLGYKCLFAVKPPSCGRWIMVGSTEGTRWREGDKRVNEHLTRCHSASLWQPDMLPMVLLTSRNHFRFKSVMFRLCQTCFLTSCHKYKKKKKKPEIPTCQISNLKTRHI